MTFPTMCMMDTLSKLEKTISNITPEQQAAIDKLKNQITEQGRYHDVCSITLEDMREHGYDVTEADSPRIAKVAEMIEMNSDELWNGMEIWAKTYGIERLEEY